MEPKCPNCQVRPAAIEVEYDEVLGANFQSVASSRGRRARSFSSIPIYGHTRLCARCAADYQRMVWLRTTGRRVSNYGFAALLISAVLYGILAAAVPAWRTSILALILASLMALALMAILVGGALFLIGLARRRSVTRFIGRASV
jgi:hypothetical protein